MPPLLRLAAYGPDGCSISSTAVFRPASPWYRCGLAAPKCTESPSASSTGASLGPVRIPPPVTTMHSDTPGRCGCEACSAASTSIAKTSTVPRSAIRCSSRACTASPSALGPSPARVTATGGAGGSSSSPSETPSAVASAHSVLSVGLPSPCSSRCRVVLLIPAAAARSARDRPADARSRCTLRPVSFIPPSACALSMRTSIVIHTYRFNAPQRRRVAFMSVSRLRHIPGIGVDVVGDAADAAADPEILRLENLDTDLRPPPAALELTRAAVDDDAANSYLPFHGHRVLREAAAAHVGRLAGRPYDPGTECVSVAGGLNGILNTLLATVEPGQEVVLTDPVY